MTTTKDGEALEALEARLDEARAAKDKTAILEAARALADRRGAPRDQAALAQALLASGDAEGALAALDAVEVAREGFHPMLRARILEALGRTEDAADAALWAVDLNADDEAARRLRLDLLERIDPAAAAEEADQALERLPDSFPVHKIVLERIADPLSRPILRRRAMASLDRLAGRVANPVPALVLLCVLAVKGGDHAGLAKWSKRGLDAYPNEAPFATWAARAAAMANPDRAAHRTKAAQGGDESAPSAYPGARQYKAAIALIDAGRLDEGLAELEALQTALDADPKLAPPNIRKRLPAFLPALRVIREATPEGGGLAVEAFETLRDGPVLLEKPGAKALLVVFCPGITRRAAWTRYFSAFPAHQLFVDDFGDLAGLMGLPGLGEDPKESAAAIKQIQSDLGAERLIFYGFSIGGFSALLHGALAPADHVIGCSPSSVGDPRAISEEERRIDRRAWAVTPRFVRDLPLEDGQRHYPLGDLKPLYAEGSAHPPATIFFSEGRKEDAMHAKRIAGSPDVRLAILGGEGGHWSDFAAIASGEMATALKEALQA